MRIDRLKTTPDRMGRYWVTFSDGTQTPFYRQTVEDFGLYTGKELTDGEMEALTEAAGKMSAKMRAVRIVSASSVSKRALEQRLIHKGEDPDQAREAVEWMSDLSLLDDAKVAEQVVRRCIAKGYGEARARQALYEKQVPKAYWDAALAEYPDMTDRILEFLRSRLGPDRDEKDVRRAVDALMRRGHSYGAIRRALNELSMETEEFLED